MDLALAISDVFAQIFTLEVIPRFLLPAESESCGWCHLNGVLGVEIKLLLRKYVELCAQNLECSTPAASLLSMIATTENLKVVNERKRMCLDRRLDPAFEWHVVSVLLRSHLYRHSKSPMLWFHRRWLLQKFKLSTSPVVECEVVQQAAAHHPKNYYAWGYFRWYCEWARVREQPEQYKAICNSMKKICLQNLGDVSMWTFLHWLRDEELEQLALQTSKEFPGHDAILLTPGQ